MKKLLVVLLTVVMILSVAVIASAESTNYMGGDMYYRWDSQSKNFGPESQTFFVGNIGVKASKDNSWAKIFINTDTWQTLATNDPTTGLFNGATFNRAIQYAFGVDKIGGALSLSYSSKDQDICNIGQAPLSDTFDDFKTDPVFNTYDFTNGAAAVIDTDSFTFKAEAVVNGSNLSNQSQQNTADGRFAINAIGKIDGGKFYLGYRTNGGDGKAYLADLGAEMKLGDMGLKADVWSSYNTYNAVQANLANGPWDATLFYYAPQTGTGYFGLGGNYKLTEKATVGAKYFSTSTAQYEVYGLYNLGTVDVRVGYVKSSGGLMSDNALVPASGDGYFTVGFHASIW